jgi:glycosyltransferase involved in cell wall biosynthesis
MKILLDGTAVENAKTGVSQYATKLIEQLLELDSTNTYGLLLRPHVAPDHPLVRLAGDSDQLSVRQADIPPIGLRRETGFYRLRTDYDIFHSLSSNLPLAVGYNAVVTVHDLKYVLYPRYLGRLATLKARYLDAVFAHAAFSAAAVITVSEATRQDFLARYASRAERRGRGGLAERVFTVHEAGGDPGEDAPQTVSRFGLDRPYFLYVGELRPHKNVTGLIEAYREFRRAREARPGQEAPAPRLLIAGKPHASLQLPAELPEGVELIGYVSDDELPALYRRALAFCLTSHYEGFGLPILEAMGYGTPVITSTVSSMPEVAGDAGLLVDPKDTRGIARAMLDVAGNPELRQRLSDAGTRRAGEFTWRQTAEKTLRIYRESVS